VYRVGGAVVGRGGFSWGDSVSPVVQGPAYFFFILLRFLYSPSCSSPVVPFLPELGTLSGRVLFVGGVVGVVARRVGESRHSFPGPLRVPLL